VGEVLVDELVAVAQLVVCGHVRERERGGCVCVRERWRKRDRQRGRAGERARAHARASRVLDDAEETHFWIISRTRSIMKRSD